MIRQNLASLSALIDEYDSLNKEKLLLKSQGKTNKEIENKLVSIKNYFLTILANIRKLTSIESRQL